MIILFFILFTLDKVLHNQKSLSINSEIEAVTEESIITEQTNDQTIREPIEVFLIYSRESEEFLSQIEKLTKDLTSLKKYNVQVSKMSLVLLKAINT